MEWIRVTFQFDFISGLLFMFVYMKFVYSKNKKPAVEQINSRGTIPPITNMSHMSKQIMLYH